MSSSRPIREGIPLKYQMWETGAASSMWPCAPGAPWPGDLHAAAVADLALVADLLVLAAVALPVLGGSEDALAEQAVPLRLQGAVVDGLRLFDLAVRPLADLLRGGDANLNGVKLRITHRSISSLFSQNPRRRSPLRPWNRSCSLPLPGHRRRSPPSGVAGGGEVGVLRGEIESSSSSRRPGW